MADFIKAFLETEKKEGANIWTMTKGDAGGETWSGISRRANPKWKGWEILDAIPNKKHGYKYVTDQLETLKRALYKSNYWDMVWGDRIESQPIAGQMYDTAVNAGVVMAIKFQERVWKLPDTGKMSEVLINKINSVV
jgi:lysozyme family protein